jgi:hypothetical protein
MAVELAEPALGAPGRERRALAGWVPWTGFAGSLLIAATAPVWRLAGPTWRITLPFLPHKGERPITPILFFIGAGLLGFAWLGLIADSERKGVSESSRRRRVLCTAALWFAPVLLGPPLLSSDIYSYAGEGDMVTQGLDPTSGGMYQLCCHGNPAFMAHVDPTWRTREDGNPYGPAQMGLAAGAVWASGHDFTLTIVLLRLLALGGVVLAIFGVEKLARFYGVSPPLALAIGIANPIVVLHLVGGGHNDALLLGLLTLGMALALRGRWWLGVTLVVLATAVKLPAAAALVYLGWTRLGAGAAVRARVRETAKVLGYAIGLIAVLCAMVGIGFGWIAAMKNTGSTTGTLSPTTQLGFVTNSLFRLAGISESPDLWVGLFRLAGLAAAGVLSLRWLRDSDGIGPVRATALCLFAVVLLGPVVWPWYLAPAIALLAAAGMGKARASFLLLTGLFAVEVMPSGPLPQNGAYPVLEHQHTLALFLLAGIFVLVAMGPSLFDLVGRHAARFSHQKLGEAGAVEPLGVGTEDLPLDLDRQPALTDSPH